MVCHMCGSENVNEISYRPPILDTRYDCCDCKHRWYVLPGGTIGEEIKFPILIDESVPNGTIRIITTDNIAVNGTTSHELWHPAAQAIVDEGQKAAADAFLREHAATLHEAAAIRARLVARFLAVTGDQPTAERLADEAIRALEEGE